MNNIQEKISSYYQNGDKLLLAVSGGADSMVLLHATNSISKDKDLSVRVVTINHGIRGKEAERDVDFVKSECEKLKIPCEVVNIDVPKLSKETKTTTEEAARIERYNIFEKMAAENEKIVVAHNKDDQVETVLMHLFRGSGIDGARGIPKRDYIIRPLIDFTKSEILDYAKQNNISYQTDSTNADLEYSRNYVRNKIIPEIQNIYPNVTENIFKFAQVCEKVEDLVDSLIEKSWFTAKNGIICVSNAAFLQNLLVVAKVIKFAYNMLGEYSDLESKHIAIVTELFEFGKNGSKVDLPHGVVAEKRNENIYFYKGDRQKLLKCEFKLGENKLPNGEIWLVSKIPADQIDFTSGSYYADYHKIPHDAVWRTREDGDKFEKLGSLGRKKLNDYFTDKKLSLKERDSQILLAKDNEVLFVVLRDISNKIKIDAGTSVIVELKKK